MFVAFFHCNIESDKVVFRDGSRFTSLRVSFVASINL
jgi:hypothetical protein